MPNIIVTCDRCKKAVDGFECPEATSGFYRSSHIGGMWDKYMAPDEGILCDACMQHDPRYQADYWPAK